MPRTAKQRAATRAATAASEADQTVATAVAGWFTAAARPLPWRTDLGPRPRARNPYHALVAELMAQQTQIGRVVPAFERFVARFPTVSSLAAAPEKDVLAMWSGLGYYRRARHLHAAARAIVAEHAGEVPADPAALRQLPGVGRYTAGAIASIVFQQREPIVDGNVTRVLLRLDGRADLADPGQASRHAWARAAQLVAAAPAPAAFNEGLMELGATICTPAPSAPACDRCPLAALCRARADGTQGTIPSPRKTRPTPTVHCATIVARDAKGRLLLEQRPDKGMWASLWQCPTLESAAQITRGDLRTFAQLKTLDPASLRRCGSFTHQTTHRTMRFAVYAAAPVACRRKAGSVQWVLPAQLGALALSNAQRKALALAGATQG